jgi:hypothetical protein
MILIPMLLKCSHIFHPMAKFGLVANMQTNEERSFNIFEMFIGTSMPTKEVVNKDL